MSKLTLTDILILATFPLTMSVGQLLFRQSALNGNGTSFLGLIPVLLRTPSFLLALALYAASTLLWVWLLGRYTLSVAYPFAALAILLVPLLESLLFSHKLSFGYWVGLCFIIIGVCIVVKTQSPAS
jgi:drug/metabolite transporter (DMT)-like permease